MFIYERYSDAPQCGQSRRFKTFKCKFQSINVLEDENLRQGIKEYSDWPTSPTLYKEFIGGCDIVKEMFEKGELKKVLEDKKLI